MKTMNLSTLIAKNICDILFKKSIKCGRCASYNQCWKSTISDEVFNFISKKLGVNGNTCEILEKYFEYTNKQRKVIEGEYDSQFKDYRDKDEDERTKHINKELNKVPIYKKLQN